MIVVFIIGYFFIVVEHVVNVNKAAFALLIGVLSWGIYAIGAESILNLGFSHSWSEFSVGKEVDVHLIREFVTQHELFHHLGDISSILFFLLGAMTIVELIDRYQGFSVITSKIDSTSITKLIWIVGGLTFFMSALLDNLTTTIILLTLLKKMISKKEFRWLFASLVVMAANAGGAWSPIGDVTTIMLWIGGQITAGSIVTTLIMPSIVNTLVVTAIFARVFKGHRIPPQLPVTETSQFTTRKEQVFMLVIGSIALISVPIFKAYTHLPPFMGMMLGLGVMWVITDRYMNGRSHNDKRRLTVSVALKSVDIETILFFLGILLGVSALQSAGQLDVLAGWLQVNCPNVYASNICIGVLSAIVDNVPLVAASMGMYDVHAAGVTGAMADYVQDGNFWNLLAYCAGTGGSILIIGSAAGVAAMGIEKIDFVWYMRRMAPIAFAGYMAGVLMYYVQSLVF